MKNVPGLMVSESICSSNATQVAPAATLTATTSGGEVSLVARVVKEKLKGAASGVPLMSLAPTVMLALNMVLAAKSAVGLKAAILLAASYVTVPVTPATIKVPALMLAGSMALLKTTATARLVPTPLVCGTTINTVGASETIGAGELERPLQPTRRAANRRTVETLGNCGIDMGIP